MIDDSDSFLDHVFANFSQFVRQLNIRHEERASIEVKDEYDVQDLLHAILLLYFYDVRTEECTSSFAGGCNRMDFLLKEQKTAIEVKMTRKRLGDTELGDQLLIDIAKYQQHENVNKLYCFVYDPERRVTNPIAIVKDLEKQTTKDFKVIVKIAN